MVQIVMGIRRLKAKMLGWRLMERYELLKKNKGSGRTIIATARKLATIIWHMLTEEVEFDMGQMIDHKLLRKSVAMRESVYLANDTMAEEYKKPVPTQVKNKSVEKLGVAGRKRKKVG